MEKSNHNFNALNASLQNFRRDLAIVSFITVTELKSKIYDKSLGMFFLFLEPILMASVYYFLTMVLLGERLETFGFLGIYSSVVFWRWYSRISDAAPGIFITYAQVIRQTNFPTHTIILATVAVESANLMFGIVVLTGLMLGLGGQINHNIIFLPMILLTQVSVIIFFSICLSCLGVFFKDLGGIIFALNGIWFYLSPGIYPVELVPEKYLTYYYMNPFAHILPAYRQIFLEGTTPDLGGLLVILAIFSFLAAIAFRVVKQCRKNFFSFM